jgi:hypothetical protein
MSETGRDRGRPLTVAELVFRLADFDGDEPVYAPGLGGVRSARRVKIAGVPRVVLSNLPEPERPEPPETPRRWRGVVEALRGLASVRVGRGPLGSGRA